MHARTATWRGGGNGSGPGEDPAERALFASSSWVAVRGVSWGGGRAGSAQGRALGPLGITQERTTARPPDTVRRRRPAGGRARNPRGRAAAAASPRLLAPSPPSVLAPDATRK